MTLKVRDKTFSIELVNNYVHQLHEKMISIAGDMAGMSDSLQDEFEAYAERLGQAKSKQEIRDIKKEYRETLENFEKIKKECKDELINIRNEMVKEILETNNLEYDGKWWIRYTDPDDVNDFIVKCVDKDIDKSKKKETTKK